MTKFWLDEIAARCFWGAVDQGIAGLGYEVTRQRGSHIRITTQRDGEHHEAIPNHDPLKPGLLAGVLKSVAAHHRITKEELLRLLDL